MGKFTLKNVLFIIMLTLVSTTMMGQNSKNSTENKFKGYWFIGVEGGGTVLYGDNKANQFDKLGFNANFDAGYAFGKHFTVYGRIGVGTLDGKLENSFSIDESNFLSGDLNLSADLISLLGGYKQNRVFGMLIHAGIGGLHYRTTATTTDGIKYNYGYSDSPKDMKGNGIDSRMVAFDVPMGVMFKFKVTRKLDLYADISMTYADTDALDGMRHGKHKDWFGTGNIGLRYNFVKNDIKEPVIVETPEDVVQETPVKEVEETVQEEVVVAPVVPVKKETRSEYDLIFRFSVNDANIQDEITGKSGLDLINKLDDAEIETIKIVSYSSPEGKNETNANISNERADAVKKYLADALGSKINDAKYDITIVGADWENYLRLLENSNVKNKEYVINKLNSSNYKAGTLWALSSDYPEIMDFYSELRRVEVKITIVQK